MQMSGLFSAGAVVSLRSPPAMKRSTWGRTPELRGSQGHKGQDRRYVQVTGGEPRLNSPILPLRTLFQGGEVRAGVDLALPTPPWFLTPDWGPHGNLVKPSAPSRDLAGSYVFLCLSLPSCNGKKKGRVAPYLTGATRASSSLPSLTRQLKGAGLRCWGE